MRGTASERQGREKAPDAVITRSRATGWLAYEASHVRRAPGVFASIIAAVSAVGLTAERSFARSVASASLGGLSSDVSASGLPDGRVYEQVSPPNKNGNLRGQRWRHDSHRQRRLCRGEL